MKYYSTFAVARMMQVDPGSVSNWVDQGFLKAFRTPGGHRRIAADELARFLSQRQVPLPPDLAAPARRILVIENRSAKGRQIRRAIRRRYPEAQVEWVQDVFHAGAAIATLKPDVIVVDPASPGFRALDIPRELRAQPETRHTVVVGLAKSAKDARRLRQQGLRVCPGRAFRMEDLLREVSESLRLAQAG